MSYDISIVQSVQGTQGYFDTSLQTFDLFGTGDREQNTERERERTEDRTRGWGGEKDLRKGEER